MLVPFESLPDHSRIWIYQSNRKFNSQEIIIISELLSSFLKGWNAHGVSLKSSFDIRFNQFVILAADENSNAASGCSIDDSVRVVKELAEKLGVDFFDRALIAFKKQEEVITIPVPDLKKKYQDGVWNNQTLLINNLVNMKGDLNKGWLVPAELTWLKRYLPKETVVD